MTEPKGRGRFPGFDGLRLLAAASVIFSHAFLIASGSEDAEPFVRLLGPGNILGLYGVYTFFIISGFLLARSLTAHPGAVTYVVNRTLRILPAFVLCAFATAFVIGPLCSALGARAYLASSGPYLYSTTLLQSLNDASLPGVYSYQAGDVFNVVNGSLWSLHYEALSYVLLLLVWTAAPSAGAATAVVGVMALLVWVLPMASAVLTSVEFTLPYFACGVLMYWVYRRYGVHRVGGVCAVVLLVAGGVFGVERFVFAPAGAYLVVLAAERQNIGSAIAERIGDCSYGLYLYGWPCEQMVKQFTHLTSPMAMFALALPLTLACSLVSCHLLEQPAMRLRFAAAGRVNALVEWLLSWSDGGRRLAVLGAKAAFVVSAAVILLSKVQWWYFMDSMVDVLLSVVAGAAGGWLLHSAATTLRPRTETAKEEV